MNGLPECRCSDISCRDEAIIQTSPRCGKRLFFDEKNQFFFRHAGRGRGALQRGARFLQAGLA